MKNISDHDLSQMDEVWQANLSEPTVRSLLTRTLDELRVARDRLNQNPDNSSRPPGSMPPWQSGDAKAKPDDSALMDTQDEDDNSEDGERTAPKSPKDTQPTNHDNAVAGENPIAPAPQVAKRAGRPVGAPGHGRSQKLTPNKFVYRHPDACEDCLQPFTAHVQSQARTAWDTLELCSLPQRRYLTAADWDIS